MEPFNTSIRLTGEDARTFREYDKNPWKYENVRSLEAARRAREIAKTLNL